MKTLTYKFKLHEGYICYPEGDESWQQDRARYEKKGYTVTVSLFRINIQNGTSVSR